ncbi:MAG: hypothetical protein GY822_17045 [Deltaproteobacteria bacterium]|nr:hypothetical protein [Deltaproteobacteria bacterium]
MKKQKARKRASSEARLENAKTFRVPATLTLVNTQYRSMLIQMIEKIKVELLIKRRSVVLDFTSTSKIHVDGMILLFSEVSRLKKFADSPVKIGIKMPKRGKTNQVLRQIGMYQLLGIAGGRMPRDKDVVSWNATSDSTAVGEKFETILQGVKTENEATDGLYISTTESMTNAMNHAYISPRITSDNHGHLHRWWMFSQVRNGELTVVFCDLGIGIPASLREKRPTFIKKLVATAMNEVESCIIESATKPSATRTRLEHRGKGLPEMIKHLDRHKKASLRILSNMGSFYRSAGQTKKRDYNESIGGTLLIWTIQLEKEPS